MFSFFHLSSEVTVVGGSTVTPVFVIAHGFDENLNHSYSINCAERNLHIKRDH